MLFIYILVLKTFFYFFCVGGESLLLVTYNGNSPDLISEKNCLFNKHDEFEEKTGFSPLF